MAYRSKSLFRHILTAVLPPAVFAFGLLFLAAWGLAGQPDSASTHRLLLAVACASLIVLAVGVSVAARRIAAPIRTLADDAEAVASGNLDVDFDEEAGGANEVRALRDSLAKVVDELRMQNELRLSVAEAELERARVAEYSEARGRFLVDVSHEIRTPMNAIVGLAELMRNSHLDAKQAVYARDIKESTEALLSIINEIMDLSKMESGGLALVGTHYDFRTMLDGLAGVVRDELKAKPLVRFDMNVSGSIPDCLLGDEARLRQLLSNVLSNAVRYTNKGIITLDVSADRKYVHFRISDTGAGIAPEDLPGIFDPINQSQTGSRSFSEGASLGLVIANRIVTAMDGSMRVESKMGRGSVFTITIPRVDGSWEMVASDRTSGRFAVKDARALVVDDNEVNLNVVAGLISLYGIACDKASGGREAIEMLKRTDYDIVLMDYMMPEMDGIRTTSIIRAQGGRFAMLPIVALTANAVIGASEMFLSSGFDDFLPKPIEMPRLRSVLTRWLPEEKILPPEGPSQAAKATAPVYTEVIDAASGIAELDVALGIERTAMQQDIYEESLRLTVSKSAEIVASLKEALSANDLESLRLHSHSAKGSLSGIGATSLSLSAADIERAASSGNMEFCRRNLPAFLKRLSKLSSDLGSLFPVSNDGPSGRGSRIAYEFDMLKDAMASYDSAACVEITNRLEAMVAEGELAEGLGTLRLLIERLEHGAATSLLEVLRRTWEAEQNIDI